MLWASRVSQFLVASGKMLGASSACTPLVDTQDPRRDHDPQGRVLRMPAWLIDRNGEVVDGRSRARRCGRN